MANPDIPFGFIASPLIRSRPHSVDVGAGVIYFNDIVMAEADGYAAPATAGSTAIIGSALDYSAGSTAGSVVVAEDPFQEFHAQDNGSGTPAQGDIYSNMNHEANAPANTSLNRSGHELDGGSVATSALGFRVLDLVSAPDNTTGDNSIHRCLCVEHQYLTTTGT